MSEKTYLLLRKDREVVVQSKVNVVFLSLTALIFGVSCGLLAHALVDTFGSFSLFTGDEGSGSDYPVRTADVFSGSNPYMDQFKIREPVPFTPPNVPPKSSFLIASQSAAAEGLVADYVCTGEHDQTMINAAMQNLLPGEGRSIQLSKGTFKISNPIYLESNLTFLGAGVADTIIELMDNAPPFIYSGMIRCFTESNIDVGYFTINGNKGNQIDDDAHNYGRYGIYYQTSHNITTHNVRVTNCYGYGFDPHGEPNETSFSTGLTFRDSVADNNGWDGFTIDKTDGVILENCIADNNGRHGINIVTGTTNGVFKNNIVTHNGFGYNGKPSVGVLKGNGITVQNNQNYGTRNIRIEGNKITGSNGRGIYLSDTIDCVVTQNVIMDSAMGCMSIDSTNNTVVSMNTCEVGSYIQITQNNEGLMAEEQEGLKCVA